MHFFVQHHAIFLPLLLAIAALGLGIVYRCITRNRAVSALPKDYSLMSKLSLLPLMTAGISLFAIIYLFTTIESNLFTLDGLYFDQNNLDTLMLRYRKLMTIVGITFFVSIHLGYFLGLLGFILRGKKMIPLITLVGSLSLFAVAILYIE